MELLQRIQQGPPWTFGEWRALEDLAHHLVLRAAEVGMTNALAEAAGEGPPEPVEVHLMTLAEVPRLCSSKFPTCERWSG